jgi:ribonucleoside-diphosphate reductase alpha chain
VFRELAVSYLERFDLAHVDPTESNFDALGKGVAEGKPTGATQYVSRGLTRSRTDKLVVMSGGGGAAPSATGAGASGMGVSSPRISAVASSAPRGEAASATALKAEPEQKLSPTEKLDHLPWAEPQRSAKAVAAERRAEAKAKGYEGEMCGECLNFTLVRNGTCLKCDTCGSTTGCS